MVESGGVGGKASARGGGNGAPLQLRAQLHRLVVEQILQEHANILNDTSCSVDESTKVTFMNKCIEHMKEVRHTAHYHFHFSSRFSVYRKISRC